MIEFPDLPSELAPTLAAQPFEAEFLRGPVWSLRSVPSRSELSRVVAFFEATHTRLASSRMVTDQGEDPARLRRGGFRFVETLVTFEHPLGEGAPLSGQALEIAGPDEADAIAEIAGKSFRSDRFHADPFLSNATADALKAAWARNDVMGRADSVFFVRSSNRIVGFNACLVRADAAIIDLIAVAPEAQGNGYGRALVAGAIAHYSGRVQKLLVGTQETNKRSTELYHSIGFREMTRKLTYHWTPGAEGGSA